MRCVILSGNIENGCATMNNIIELVKKLYLLKDYDFKEIPPHEGGRNRVCVCSQSGEDKYVLRISALGDRKESDYHAEAEFIRFLAENSAPVADVVPSVTGKLVESIDIDERKGYISLFEYAKGMLISDNGYQYHDGVPLEEYFYNTGKTLGIIHRLSKNYTPLHRRIDYRERYKPEYLNSLIPDSYGELKNAIEKCYERFGLLPINKDSYGLVHFDFSDGNYHIDMNTGRITVFDFDNCMYCCICSIWQISGPMAWAGVNLKKTRKSGEPI